MYIHVILFTHSTYVQIVNLLNKEKKNMYMMFVPHRKHMYRHPLPPKGIDLPTVFTNTAETVLYVCDTIQRGKASSGMLRRAALVKTDVSGERSASFIRVTKIGELGTTLAVTSNRLVISSQHASVASYS
jgi:hypothetical protein